MSIYPSRQFSNETHPFTPVELRLTSRYHQPLSFSGSSRRSPVGDMAPEGLYSCNICGVTRTYTRRGDLMRHHYDVHDSPRVCLYCDYQWARPNLYRDHLRNRHPDVDPNVDLRQRNSTRKLCMYCDVEWIYSRQYYDHLREHHPQVDPDVVLGEAQGSRRRNKIIARFY